MYMDERGNPPFIFLAFNCMYLLLVFMTHEDKEGFLRSSRSGRFFLFLFGLLLQLLHLTVFSALAFLILMAAYMHLDSLAVETVEETSGRF